MPVDEKLYPCPQVLDSSTNKYAPYVDSSRSYVVAGSTKCLDVSWPYSVSPSSGIIQPVQVVSSQLDLAQKACGKLPKHDGISPNHSSPPVSAGLITPKMEDKTDPSLLDSHHIMAQNSVTPQHFSPLPTSEVPRQTVLMWGSNHIQNRSPSSHGYSTPQPSDTCDSLGNMGDMGGPEMCKWNGEAGKTEAGIQNVEPESPQQHHSNHHNNHHNNRVVMVL